MKKLLLFIFGISAISKLLFSSSVSLGNGVSPSFADVSEEVIVGTLDAGEFVATAYTNAFVIS